MKKDAIFYSLFIVFVLLFNSCSKDDGPSKGQDDLVSKAVTIAKMEPEFGLPGTSALITGTGYDNTTTVTFNGVATEVVNATETTLLVKIPVATTGKVKVYKGENSATSTNDFTIPEPKITSITYPEEPAYLGEAALPGLEITLVGSNFVNDVENNSIDFNGTEATNIEVIDNSKIVLTVPEGATTGPLSLTSGAYTTISNFVISPWERLTDFPGAIRSEALMVVVGDKLYVIMGVGAIGNNNNNGAHKDIWEYDPSGNEGEGIWTEKAPYPEENGRFAFASFVINNEIYIACGTNNTDMGNHVFYKFNPNDGPDGTWTKLADFNDPNDLRMYASFFAVNGKGYVVGGRSYNVSDAFTDTWEFDPLSAVEPWTVKAADLVLNDKGIVGAHSFVIDDTAYLCGGDNIEFLKNLWAYNVVDDVWEPKANFGGDTGRFGGVSFSVEGKGYFGMGADDEGNLYKDLWEYDPSSDTWTQKTSVPREDGLLFASMVGKGKEAYLGFGKDGGPDNLKEFWKYTPHNDTH